MANLIDKLKTLPPEALKIIEKLVDAASQQSSYDCARLKHWLISQKFYSAFGMRLAMYHAVTKCPVNKKAFESLLFETCTELGFVGEMPESHTADIDLVIQGKKLSLKSEGEIHDDVHISKFCELGKGPWEKGSDLYFKIHRKKGEANGKTFESRIDLYDCVLVLRNDLVDGITRYQLLEIPVKVFRRILDIPLTNYNSEMASSKSRLTPKSFKVRTPASDKRGAREIAVLFDGGGERKLTITIPKEVCPTLAEWTFKL